METRDFKGIWIPKEVWLDNRLSALEKIIFAEIDSLDVDENGCFAGNDYLAEFSHCSETKVSLAIKKLIECDYIYVKKFDGRTRFLKSRVSKSERQSFKLCEADFQKVKGSYIYDNKEYNINDKKENISNDIKEKEQKHSYGEFNRIKLTDTEYQRLCKDYTKEVVDKKIAELDEYVEQNNNKNKYTNFNLVIRKAIRENWFDRYKPEPKPTEEKSFDANEWLERKLQHNEDN